MNEAQRSSILRAASTALALAVVLLLSVAATPGAQAQTYEVLHGFHGTTDGGFPGSLISDAVGNLYGPTQPGGDPICFLPQNGCGVVFKLDTTGKETALHSFTGGADGSLPPLIGSLLRDEAGNLYGTTQAGGDLKCAPEAQYPGCGVVFKLDTTGKETVLHTFSGGTDGAAPGAGLIPDEVGNLYGITFGGGDLNCFAGEGCGVVFKLSSTTRKLIVLHTFTGIAEGVEPNTGLIRDAAGNLYGTAGGGAYNSGIVFKLSATTPEFTVLYAFTGGADGGGPASGVIRDAAGNLYGTTYDGGAPGCSPELACGVVFKLDTTGKETVLYAFTGGADGGSPFGGLLRDAAGNLYGTTEYGGDLTCNAPYGCGVVFKLDTTGRETALHTFNGLRGGHFPFAGVIEDAAGNFYGTTEDGGNHNCEPGNNPPGCGVVFKLTPLK